MLATLTKILERITHVVTMVTQLVLIGWVVTSSDGLLQGLRVCGVLLAALIPSAVFTAVACGNSTQSRLQRGEQLSLEEEELLKRASDFEEKLNNMFRKKED